LGGYVDLAKMPAKTRAAELTRLSSAGVSGVRLPLDWNRVEPEPNRFAWKADDDAVDAARAHKLDVMLVLGPCAAWAVDPAWQVPPADRPSSIPRSTKLWERYVRQAALHFKGRVRHWQVREQPNAHNFRGARSEYLKLVTTAARVLRAVDPAAVVIVSEGGSLDVAEIDRLCRSDQRSACDVLGVYLPAGPTSVPSAALAWSVLSNEVPGVAAGAQRAVWVLGSDGTLPAEVWMQQYLLAWAFGAPRLYLPAAAIDGRWLAPLSQLRYTGFLRLGPDVWALAFEDRAGPVVVAWSSASTRLRISDLAPVADATALRQASVLGDDPGEIVTGDGGAVSVSLGPRPALIRGVALAKTARKGTPSRSDVLGARPGPGPDSSLPVFVDYNRSDSPERGLYNRQLRARPGGRVDEEMHNGRVCLRTRIGADTRKRDENNPWVYFDVDERWLYFARGATPVAVTVECDASYLGKEKLGFNIMYDSTTGYRFSRWQWVEPGSGWRSYRVELPDVSFADRDGYDFRININGSKQDLWISSVRVEKLRADPRLVKR
jgi:hypothetical protein